MNIVSCPFCGSKDLRVAEWVAGWSYFNSTTYSVSCRKCGAYGPPKRDRQKAWDAWNKRKVNTEVSDSRSKQP
jgi:Lar family restriction alleviation protein